MVSFAPIRCGSRLRVVAGRRFQSISSRFSPQLRAADVLPVCVPRCALPSANADSYRRLRGARIVNHLLDFEEMGCELPGGFTDVAFKRDRGPAHL